ncbi:MFS general substrate transporter [Rhizodiscina lignyota]|uniref:MFS general substrate transporter n=1 Tax=Rhizodiscina lignyota TaxID=1504668 RepID=A0A9P4IIZ4_9PEZI|nr:MFS general substrate transporter [Rhizodiscina lignyota]
MSTDPLALCDPQPPGDFEPPPDGGWLAWLHAVFGAFAIFNCWGLNLSFGVFEAYYKTIYIPNHSHSTIAWIGSIQLFLIFFTAIVVGRCYDFGWSRVFFTGGSIGLVIAVYLTSLCKSWGALFAVQGILTGMMQGMVFCSGILVVTEYFDKNLGLAIGISAAGSSVGGIVYSLMAQHLLLTAGFEKTIQYMGIVVILTMIPSNIVLRSRRKKRSGKAQQAVVDFGFLRDPSYLMLLWGMFFSFWSLYFGFYYIVSYAYNVLQLPPEQSTNVLLVMLAANLPGRFVPALLSDRCLGPINTLIPSVLITALVIFLWIGTNTPSGLYILGAFYGFASAGLQSLFSPAITEFCRGDDGTKGLKNAVVFVAIGLACLTGTPIGGALIDSGNTPEGLPYLWAQIFAGGAMTLGGICFIASRVMKVGWGPVRT